ncbi:ATP-dependent helicase [Candidatus Saccharibacteria bacterium]|nr:ATP-dependent helicase [Candidatus Saccharibacteria bacterium]
MVRKIENFFIVNAPAGSGKTTTIREMINNIISINSKDNVLCITYTNRAADELSKSFSSPNISISTIHSFLNNFMKQYFGSQEIIDLYFDTYQDSIQQRIDNREAKENQTESNKKYIEKYGDLSIDVLRRNITNIYYNENSFNSLYYGGLGHDDLISFSSKIILKYKVIQNRLSYKFQYVFIDEYQDTTADVLNIFYESLNEKRTILYLFGDKMQQIYKNYDGSFEPKFLKFDSSKALTTNYRSIPKIITLLNNIYNDSSFVQNVSEDMNKIAPNFDPRVIICNDVDEKLTQILDEYPNSLTLFLSNQSRFQKIGCPSLYSTFSKMDRYSFSKKYGVVDVLTDNTKDNPDSLMRLFFSVAFINNNYASNNYGVIVQKIKDEQSTIGLKDWKLSSHQDKVTLNAILEELALIVSSSKKSIKDVLIFLKEKISQASVTLSEIMEDESYSDVLEVPIEEVIKLYNYLESPKVSTQHGVKGESHDEVIFIADDSRNPSVSMYKFFNIWSDTEISLSSSEEFYYQYSLELTKITEKVGMKISDLNADRFNTHKNYLKGVASSMMTIFQENDLFNRLCLQDYQIFISRPNVTNAKKCFKESQVYGILSAYKLFYVGCSRARKDITVLLDSNKIEGNMDLQIQKFEQLGFNVCNEVAQ